MTLKKPRMEQTRSVLAWYDRKVTRMIPWLALFTTTWVMNRPWPGGVRCNSECDPMRTLVSNPTILLLVMLPRPSTSAVRLQKQCRTEENEDVSDHLAASPARRISVMSSVSNRRAVSRCKNSGLTPEMSPSGEQSKSKPKKKERRKQIL